MQRISKQIPVQSHFMPSDGDEDPERSSEMSGLKWRHDISIAERAGFFHWQFLNNCSDKSHGGALGQGNEKKVLREEGYFALETDAGTVQKP